MSPPNRIRGCRFWWQAVYLDPGIVIFVDCLQKPLIKMGVVHLKWTATLRTKNLFFRWVTPPAILDGRHWLKFPFLKYRHDMPPPE